MGDMGQVELLKASIETSFRDIRGKTRWLGPTVRELDASVDEMRGLSECLYRACGLLDTMAERVGKVIDREERG